MVIICLSLTSCSSNRRLEDLPRAEYRGFIIQERRGKLDIRKPLDFIMIKDPLIYRLLKAHVKRIEYSAYYPDRNYPSSDVINISRFSLERGEAHSASVLVHELIHIILNNVRKNSSLYRADEKTFLLKAGIKYDDIKSMMKKEEERASYLYQYGFIRKYGTEKDIEYQKRKLEKLGVMRDHDRRQ